MLRRNNLVIAFIVALVLISNLWAETLEDNWNDFLHYVKIARFDLAKGYAQAVLDSEPDSVELLSLSQSNPNGYAILLQVKDATTDTELAELSQKVFDIIEQGRYAKRTDPQIIFEEVKRLNSTERGRFIAIKRLRDAGEYSIMYLLDAMKDTEDQQELAHLIEALPQVGRDATRPLATALNTDSVAIKSEIIKALGEIGYPQTLAHLKYVAENEQSSELRAIAEEGIAKIDPAASKIPAAQLFYMLAENYYYHAESLKPALDADFGNIWFWDTQTSKLMPQKVDIAYFYELMAMRSCELALKSDPSFGKAIGLWIASFFKAESAGIAMPEYFGSNHATASVYATTAGPEYLHQALARAVRDKNAYVASGVIEALAITAGEKSLFYRYGPAQPLLEALSFDDESVKFSAAIAIAQAGPKTNFSESGLVVKNLSEALSQDAQNPYTFRAALAMLILARTQNPIIDLNDAQEALIQAATDKPDNLKMIVANVLAYLKSPEAQKAIADMALDADLPNSTRMSAFGSLVVSAKFNANLLDTDAVDQIYSLVSSLDTDPALRTTAAAAYGALNLPSQKVKTLILDQAKN